jgi:ribosome-associated toxin RatA of RatAB toxin-antitoxin module
MPRVVIKGLVPTRTPKELTEILARFEHYPSYTPTVISVESEQTGNGHGRSAWAIVFDDGILKWVADHQIDLDQGVISFRSISGDFQSLEGSWRATPAGEGSAVTFDVTFESGLGTLSEVVDPIAERVMRQDFEVIMRAVIGDELELVA